MKKKESKDSEKPSYKIYTEEELKMAFEAGEMFAGWECRSLEEEFRPKNFNEFKDSL